MVTGEGLCKHLCDLKEGHLLRGIWLVQRLLSSSFVSRTAAPCHLRVGLVTLGISAPQQGALSHRDS